MWQDENAQLMAQVKSIVNKTINLIAELQKKSNEVKWTDICGPTREYLLDKDVPLISRKCVAQYLAKQANFPVKLGEPFDFSDAVVDIAAIDNVASKLESNSVEGKVLLDIYDEQFPRKNKFPLEQIFADFLEFFFDPKTKPEDYILELTASFSGLDKKQTFSGAKVTDTLIKSIFDSPDVNSCCLKIGSYFWDKVSEPRGIQNLLLPDENVEPREYIRQVLETAAEQLTEKNYSKGFNLFVINCLLFKLAGVGALRWTKAEYDGASTTTEFVDTVLGKLGFMQRDRNAPVNKGKSHLGEKQQKPSELDRGKIQHVVGNINLETPKGSEEQKQQKSNITLKDESGEPDTKKDKGFQEMNEKVVDLEQQLENFENRLKKTVEVVANTAFEAPVAYKIMEAASQWKDKDSNAEYERKIEALIKLEPKSYDKKELNEKLCEQLQKFRKYPRNEFVNLLVCTAQSFLTVLAGAPGSGKTSLCNYLAQVLGLTSLSKNADIQKAWGEKVSFANRYVPVSVEKGWTSKRDMIGYFNPLNRTFESNNPHLFDCLCQLDYETSAKKEVQLPYLVLLDEANLSTMEHYFADFMNICDSRNELAFVSLGGGKTIRIPDKLRFLATINNDHTTEVLSPRLIDRTWVIQLPTDKDNGEDNMNVNDGDLIAWDSFKEAYQPTENIRDEVNEDLKDIASILSSMGHPISHRSRNAIWKYVSAAQDFMDDDKGKYHVNGNRRASYYAALDYAVMQKILPVINGSGEEYEKNLVQIRNQLQEKSLTKSADKLTEVINVGKTQMGYYKF